MKITNIVTMRKVLSRTRNFGSTRCWCAVRASMSLFLQPNNNSYFTCTHLYCSILINFESYHGKYETRVDWTWSTTIVTENSELITIIIWRKCCLRTKVYTHVRWGPYRRDMKRFGTKTQVIFRPTVHLAPRTDHLDLLHADIQLYMRALEIAGTVVVSSSCVKDITMYIIVFLCCKTKR